MYIPYHLDGDGKALAREGTDPHMTQVIPLMKRLQSVLQETHLAVRLAKVVITLQPGVRLAVITYNGTSVQLSQHSRHAGAQYCRCHNIVDMQEHSIAGVTTQ